MPNWNKHYVVDIAVSLVLTFLLTKYPQHRLPTCHPEQRRRIPGNGHPVITQKHSNANQHKHLTNFAREPAETALGGEPTKQALPATATGLRSAAADCKSVRANAVARLVGNACGLNTAVSHCRTACKNSQAFGGKSTDNVCFARFGGVKSPTAAVTLAKIFRKSYFVEFRRSAFGFVWRCFSCHLRRLEKKSKICAKCG